MPTGISRRERGGPDEWRTEVLYKLGVPYEQAEKLARLRREAPDAGYAVDVHYVESLMVGGATWQQAVNLANAV